MGTDPGDSPVIMGRISGAYGVKGWVRVFDHSRERGGILDYRHWLIRSDAGWEQRQLAEGRCHGNGVVARLEDCEDRNQAVALMGRDIAIRRDQLEELAKGEYYWHQLKGLEVVNTRGESLGRVRRLLETGANDVLVLEGEQERLIPYVPDTIKQVDLTKGLIEVAWDRDF